MRDVTAWRELVREWRSNRGLRVGSWLLVATLLGVLGGTFAILESDRAALAEKFEAEREIQLQDVTALVASEFEDIHDDLELTASLAHNVYPEQQESIVMALLGAVRAYRGAALVDVQGTTKFVSDPRSEGELSEEARAAMLEAGRQAIEKGTYVSPRVGGEDSWYRAFAQVVPTGEGALVLLVDTRSFLDDLRVLSSDPQTLVVVLGPQGRLARVTSEVVSRQVEAEREPAELKRLLAAMLASEHGSYRLRWKEAAWTGFEPGDVVVAHRRISAMPGSHWAVATLTSLSAIRSHEEAVTVRLVWFATFVSTLLVGFGLYLIVTTRRTARLRERLRTASELAHLHQKADTVLQTMPLAVCVVGDDGVVTDANASWGLRWSHLRRGATLLEDGAEALNEKLRAALGGEPSEYFVEDDTLFGHEGSFHVYLEPFEPSHPDARALVVVEDISTTRKLETQLLRAEKLSTVGVLAAGIAHEIGTPLGVVRGRAELMLGKTEPESANARGLRVIIDQIDRVSRIIQELLDFSRVDVARTDGVDLRATLETVGELLRLELASREVSLVVDVEDALPLLAADRDRLVQVLVNLVVNARDAMESSAFPRTVTVSARAEEGQVRMVVSDTGAGIPGDALHRIFDPFFTTKKRGQGTGLGLAVVSQIVRNHGGRVDVWSEPGVGTRFELIWPQYRGPRMVGGRGQAREQ